MSNAEHPKHVFEPWDRLEEPIRKLLYFHSVPFSLDILGQVLGGCAPLSACFW